MLDPASPSTRRTYAMGTLAVVIAASSWGLWSLSVRPAALPAMTFALIVFVVMGVVTLPAVALSAPATWSRRALLLLFMNGVWDAVNVLTFFGALRETTVAVAVLTHYLAPVLVAVMAPSVDGERVRGAVPGAIIACAGLTLVLEPWRGEVQLLGALLGTVSAFAYAGNVFTVRRLVPLIGAPRVIAYHSFVAAVLVAPFAIHTGVVPGAEALAWSVSGAIVLGAASGVLYVRGLAVIGAARAAMLAYAEPVVAVVVGALAWGEPVGALALAGVALIVGSGVYVAKP
ncbi:MAG TPA: DMT family transporter [Kofleriaceae bacterium]|nr:DMT family transporter [Kofleriaceae bacterium]